MKSTFFSTKLTSFILIGICVLIIASFAGCALGYHQSQAQNAPVQSANIDFAANLSTYNIYQGVMSDLIPSDDFHLLELSTALFTDYAEKQRLVKVPAGTMMVSDGDGLPVFPDGTILVKTFYYYHDVRNPSAGKRIIETRLEIKQDNRWDIVSYVWNDAQTEATLAPNGLATQVSWVNDQGLSRRIAYEVPSQAQCIECHRTAQNEVIPIGPKLRNLNHEVIRFGESVNQLQHLQSMNTLNSFDHTTIASLPNINDPTVSLAEKGRAYLDMNCSHCHQYSSSANPTGKRLDFRYETPLANTRIMNNRYDIVGQMRRGAMPFIGTTVLDEEGFALVQEYISSLQ